MNVTHEWHCVHAVYYHLVLMTASTARPLYVHTTGPIGEKGFMKKARAHAAATVELFFKEKRVASHPRSTLPGRYTTLSAQHARLPQTLPRMDALPHYNKMSGGDGPSHRSLRLPALPANHFPNRDARSPLSFSWITSYSPRSLLAVFWRKA